MTNMNMLNSTGLKSALALLSIISVFTTVDTARGCSPPDPGPGYFDLGAVEPDDGASNVAIDSAVVIELNYVESGRDMTVSITLTNEETGEQVDGEQFERYWDTTIVSFKPTEDLQPNTAYHVTATTTSLAERPAEATGVEELSTTFTTGASRLPPLSLNGTMRVELDEYERDYYPPCEGTCSCPPDGSITDTRATVFLPGASGGQGTRGYHATVTAMSDGGATVNVNATAVFGEAETELQLGFLRGEEKYSPCFELRLRDLAEHTIEAQTLCLDTEIPALGEPMAIDAGNPTTLPEAGAPAPGDSASPVDQPDQDVNDATDAGKTRAPSKDHSTEDSARSTGSSCQLTSGRAGRFTGTSIAGLFALFTAAAGRRRRAGVSRR